MTVEPKVGVYVCRCGGNISDVVKTGEVREMASHLPGVTIAREMEHACGMDSQEVIMNDIKELGLDRVVVACCTPHMHEATFEEVLKEAGLNPYMLEIANIREHCSWVHYDQPEEATEKAKSIVAMAVAKILLSHPLHPERVTIGKRVVVIGGGISGVMASLDLANAGFNVQLVERKPTLGGMMAKLTRTFPTDDCSMCVLAPRLSEVATHPNVTVHTYTEIKGIEGYVGNFEVTLLKKPRYVDESKCVSCGECSKICPVKLPNEFDYGLSQRKAIYLPFEEAVPKRYLIDPENCLKLTKNVCEVCKKVCKADAIDFEMKEETVKVTADAIIIATGIEAFDARLKENYGYGRYKNVIISPQIERMIVPTGPTRGKIIRPGDGKEPKRFAFILCVGSRDEQVGNLYCSRVCCMYAIKEASFLKRRDPSRSIYLFYTDIRAFGKGFEEYYKEAQKVGVKFIRGRVAEIKENPETGNLTVKAENTLTGEIVELEFDLIVLAVGLVANPGSTVIKEYLKLPVDSYGFFTEAHPKLKPVETILDGVFICGCAAGPKDIPDSVAQAGAAAAKTMNLLAREAIETDPIRVYVDDALCDGCGECLEACPLKAISLKENKAAVNPLLCKGCGSCVGFCSKGALNLANYTDAQLEAMIKAAVERSFTRPLLLVFIDDWAAYHVSDFAGLNRLSYPPNLLFIRVPSTCRVHHRLILKALSMGVDGVFLADTEFASAPYIDESMRETDKAVGKAREALSKLGLDPERVTFIRYVSTQAPRFAMTMRKFAESMKDKVLSEEDRAKIREFLGGI